MRSVWWFLAGALTVALAGGLFLLTQRQAPEPPAAPAPAPELLPPAETEDESTFTPGVWQAPGGLQQIPLWPGPAPDMEGWPQPGERVETAQTPQALHGTTSEAAWDVSVPTMTVFPPRGPSTGAAVVVFPGGGFKAVVLTLQGTEICDWLTRRGLTCVLVKYRVPNTNHHYDPDCDCGVTPDVPRALQDAQRAIRLVRARADELHLDPDKIGVMGFSAGGYLVAQTSTILEPTYTPVDSVDQVSSRPSFALAFYPGHLCRAGDTLDPGIQVTAETPPTFLLQAWDDPVDPICNSTLYARALDAAGVPAEVHLFARGGHAFALRRNERTDRVVGAWPPLVERWLQEIEILP